MSSPILDEPDLQNTASHVARLCTLHLWPDFAGYGFNLHAEKGKSGHYIGKIDDFSPAESAGLRTGDRIVEVNGTNIGNENHSQVVQRIKANPNETTFLVVDAAADAFFNEKNCIISSKMDAIIKMQTHRKSGSKFAGEITSDVDHKFDLRLCHLKSWMTFVGYGFTINADKVKKNQFIGQIDAGSPAEHGGLKIDDRILQVNGTAISASDHEGLVKMVRMNPVRASLLVIPQAQVQLYESSGGPGNPRQVHCPELDPLTRICNVVSTSKQLGFGFNLVADKGKPGHFIDQVEDNSPAAVAGLVNGDHVVAVNGLLVLDDTHQEVVEKIRCRPLQTSLMVADADGFRKIMARKLPPTVQPVVDYNCNAVIEAQLHDQPVEFDKLDYKSATDEMAQIATDAEIQQCDAIEAHPIIETPPTKESPEAKTDRRSSPHEQITLRPERGDNPTVETISTISDRIPGPNSTHPGLSKLFENMQFASTVEEAKKKIQKKKNIKNANLSIRDKYDIFQKL